MREKKHKGQINNMERMYTADTKKNTKDKCPKEAKTFPKFPQGAKTIKYLTTIKQTEK